MPELAAQSPEGPSTRCFAFYGSLPAGDFENVHLWEGPLSAVRQLVRGNGGPYDFSPTNLWPADHEWFSWTDYDLLATKVSGTPSLVEALAANQHLECARWEPPRR